MQTNPSHGKLGSISTYLFWKMGQRSARSNESPSQTASHHARGFQNLCVSPRIPTFLHTFSLKRNDRTSHSGYVTMDVMGIMSHMYESLDFSSNHLDDESVVISRPGVRESMVLDDFLPAFLDCCRFHYLHG